MKTPASPSRRSAAVKGSALRRPLRLWMTGSIAVVMAAFVPVRSMAAESERAPPHRMLRHSPYGVDETLQRIEAAARLRGLSVLARVGGGSRSAIVLASSLGGTLVVMDEASERMELPFSVQLVESAGGGVDVAFSAVAGRFNNDLQALPAALADDLAALPDVLERALT